MHQATGILSKERRGVLACMVTEDENWVHHFEPESRRRSKHWKHPSSPPSKAFQAQSLVGKLMRTLFWDSIGPLLEHYQAKGQTMKSKRYCALLADELKPAIRTKRKGRQSQTVILQQDNVLPHKANKIFETNCDLKFERLEHRPYSLDFVRSDFHTFEPLKDAITGAHVSNDDEVINKVHSWLRT